MNEAVKKIIELRLRTFKEKFEKTDALPLAAIGLDAHNKVVISKATTLSNEQIKQLLTDAIKTL